ncbi:MAG: hypothetical protein IK038_14045 [Bacteroidaceae bacterium]|nr:hypothetical protein [Bacteroidaceae bacterium]
MSLNQEHIATLRQEIPMIARQIQLISGPEFANSVPEIAAAKQALEAYKAEAERHVAEWDRAHQPPVQSRLLNLGAFYNPGATPAPTPTPAPAPAPTAGVNPELIASIAQNPAFAALLQALQVRPAQG